MKSKAMSIRMPLPIFERLAEMAKQERRATSNLVLVLILEALEARARRAEEA